MRRVIEERSADQRNERMVTLDHCTVHSFIFYLYLVASNRHRVHTCYSLLAASTPLTWDVGDATAAVMSSQLVDDEHGDVPIHVFLARLPAFLRERAARPSMGLSF